MSKHPLYNQTGLQKDNKSHVLYALANKQMELKQLEDEYKTKIAKIKTDLIAMEQVICLFDDNCSETIEKIDKKVSQSTNKKRNSYFKAGEAQNIVLSILKTSSTPVPTADLTKEAIRIQKLDRNDKKVFDNVGKSLINLLRRLEFNNIIENVKTNDTSKMLYWQIKN